MKENNCNLAASISIIDHQIASSSIAVCITKEITKNYTRKFPGYKWNMTKTEFLFFGTQSSVKIRRGEGGSRTIKLYLV